MSTDTEAKSPVKADELPVKSEGTENSDRGIEESISVEVIKESVEVIEVLDSGSDNESTSVKEKILSRVVLDEVEADLGVQDDTDAGVIGSEVNPTSSNDEAAAVLIADDEEADNVPVNGGTENSTTALAEDLSADEEVIPVDEGDDDDESAPEDMSGFEVIDEAEITDAEDYDTISDDAEGDKRNVPGDDNSWQWLCEPQNKAPRTYTWEDFTPTEKDPRCDPDWPLATFWPVYVGNFKLPPESNHEQFLVGKVHKYFASKGLPSFMVYRFKDRFYEKYQKVVGLFDMLVYFCNRRDANRAIQWCHRDMYCGHKLNVFDGRVETFFSLQNSWCMEHLRPSDRMMAETKFENIMSRYGDVKCVTKHKVNNILIQFGHSTMGFMTNPMVKVSPIIASVPKQRFVEKTVISGLRSAMTDPDFMKMKTQKKYIISIMHGVIPFMNKEWEQKDLALLDRSKRTRQPGTIPAKIPRIARASNGTVPIAPSPPSYSRPGSTPYSRTSAYDSYSYGHHHPASSTTASRRPREIRDPPAHLLRQVQAQAAAAAATVASISRPQRRERSRKVRDLMQTLGQLTREVALLQDEDYGYDGDY